MSYGFDKIKSKLEFFLFNLVSEMSEIAVILLFALLLSIKSMVNF